MASFSGLAFGADVPNTDGDTPLACAAYSGQLNDVKTLIRNGANVNTKDKDGRTPLMHASLEGELGIVAILLKNGAKINATDNMGFSAVIYASQGGHLETTKSLFQKGANLHQTTNTNINAVYQAFRHGHVAVGNYLLEKGARLEASETGNSCLMNAASGGQVEAVTHLISLEQSVHDRNKQRSTPLHMASRNGHVEVIKCLLRHQAEINAIDSFGKTPLLKAVEHKQKKAAKYLLREGADPDIASNEGNSPLKIACKFKDEEDKLVQLLLENKANPNIADRNKDSPLHEAAHNGSSTTVKLLLEHGALIQSNSEGSTPSDIALEGNNFNMIKLFSAQKEITDTSSDQVAADSPLLLKVIKKVNIQSPQIQQLIHDIQHVYPINSTLRGKAVIINNEFFERGNRLSRREGTTWDAMNLKLLFYNLQFKSCLLNNLKANQITSQLKEELTDNDYETADSFVLCILSHGNRDIVYGVDGEHVNIGEITTLLDGKNWRNMHGKPKLIIIQACQGGYASFRDTSSGSWFIRALVEIFHENAHKDHVMDMLIKVCNTVASQRTPDSKLQVTETRSTLTKKFYLFPGYNPTN